MHRSSRRPRLRWLALPAVALCLVAGTSATASADPGPKVSDVPGLTGLANPFGLDIGHDGSLLVAEQGAPPDAESGFPGAPARILKAKKGTVTTLKSFDPGTDLTDVSYGLFGSVHYTANNQLGRLAFGPIPEKSTDLSVIETTHNPDGGQTYGPSEQIPAECLAQVPESQIGSIQPYPGIIESHVYSVNSSIFAGLLVADAAGNDVHRVGYDGKILETWVLPGRPQVITQEGIDNANVELGPDEQIPSCLAGLKYTGEPVPTSIVQGPDFAYYVSSLPGFPENPASGAIFRIDPWTDEVKLWAEGFTGAVDVTFGPDGSAYVAELFGGTQGGGAVTKIATRWTHRGLKAGAKSTVASDADGLILPTRVAVSPKGTIYAAAGIFGPDGRIVKLNP